MFVTPAQTDRIVAEVVRRLTAAGARGTSDGEAINLTDKAVLTGEIIEANCPVGSRVRIAPGVVQTPTARDAIRRRQLEMTVADGASETARTFGYLVSSQPSSRAVLRQLGWGSRVADTEEAIEKTRSAICRGEQDRIVILTDSPELISARLNRQSNVWAASMRDQPLPPDDLKAFNVVCVAIGGYAAPPLVRAIRDWGESS